MESKRGSVVKGADDYGNPGVEAAPEAAVIPSYPNLYRAFVESQVEGSGLDSDHFDSVLHTLAKQDPEFSSDDLAWAEEEIGDRDLYEYGQDSELGMFVTYLFDIAGSQLVASGHLKKRVVEGEGGE